MQKLNLILIALSITLVSCTEFPKISPKERCVIVLFPVDAPTIEESYCRCHEYTWSSDFIGRTSESINYELMKCQKLIGFSPDDSAAIYTWQEEIRLFLKRYKRK